MTNKERLDKLDEMMKFEMMKFALEPGPITKSDRLFIGILDIMIDMNQPSENTAPDHEGDRHA